MTVTTTNKTTSFIFLQMSPVISINGSSLGWLIDRENRQVYIYRPNQNIECLGSPITISGNSVLPGFSLDLTKVW